MPGAYYNENDPYASQWLRNLIAAGAIAAGEVDERSIVDVSAEDLRGFTQWHLFAGIAGWSLALRLAEWPDDRPILTASVPCQPFSAAGGRKGHADDRNLWPHAFRLIRELRPPTACGEQVEAAIAYGWLDRVFDDLEREGYACTAVDLPAASVGAPHIRQRIFWVAAGPDGGVGDAASAEPTGRQLRLLPRGRARDGAQGIAQRAKNVWADADLDGTGTDGGVGDADGGARRLRFRPRGRASDGVQGIAQRAENFWADAVWLPCRDGKARRVPSAESRILPLAARVPARVGKLRAYGNAIVPQVAAEFMRAYIHDERVT